MPLSPFNEINRTVVVGDVHGMLPELLALLHLVGLTTDDHLVMVGDLVDKGPDSSGVVKHLRNMREAGFHITLVRGNHEEKNERFRRAYARAGDKVQMKGADELLALTKALAPEDIEFLESAVLFHALPEHDALVVHAGVLPSMEHLPTSEEIGKMTKSELSKLERVMRVRHITGKINIKLTLEISDLDHLDPEPEVGSPVPLDELMSAAGSDLDAIVLKKQVIPKGSFISLGNEGPDDPFWAEVYDGRFGRIYFGHNPYPEAAEPVEFPYATGLDLGAVFGGRLAAAILEVGQEPRFVSVPASGKFADTLNEEE